MQTGENKVKSRRTPWMIGILVLSTLVLLVALQSTNLWKNFAIESSGDLLLLYALSSLNFIAFIVLGFVLLRSIVKLARERRTAEAGTQIKTRLFKYFFALSLLPIIAMAVFSYLFMNRGLERWFSQIPQNVIAQAREMQRTAVDEKTATLDSAARMIAMSLDGRVVDDATLARVANAGNLSYIEVFGNDRRTFAKSERSIDPMMRGEMNRLVEAARRGETDVSFTDRKGFDAFFAEMSGGRKLLIVPNPVTEANVGQIVDNSVAELDRLSQQQVTIRRVGLLTLGILTFLLMFASTWIALYLARGLTLPIKALAEGAGEISAGNLGHRVDVRAEDELALLVTAFNDMSAKLESNSAELRAGRKYFETVLETLPTGVVSVDVGNVITTANGAALQILGGERDEDKAGLFREHQASATFERLISRARRTGHASDQVVVKRSRSNGSNDATDETTIAVTAASLPGGGGVVVVLEDLTELIAAQRSSAWQEVARRMAHEIKNPLTPIQLSAERIARRFEKTGHRDNGAGKRIEDKGPIGDVVHESTATILREVLSLKSMVDEFSRFARLPEVELAVGNVVEAARQALDAVEATHTDIRFELVTSDVPDVLLDGEQLKRAFVNLLENSAEAFERGQTDCHVVVTVRHDPARELVIAEVADNGKGIPPSDLQKLFQPYFSTKGRGTGLGLAIVGRIVSEHHGRIYAAANQPKGARFTIELPVS